MNRTSLASALLLALPLSAKPQSPQGTCPPHPSHIRVDSGVYSSGPGVTFQLHHFAAELVARGSRSPSCYEKITVVDHADIFVSNESLTNVFAEKIASSDSKIKDLKIENADAGAKLSGTIKKLIPIAFSIEGPVTTDGTSIILEASKIKAEGIPVKALLEMVGEDLGSVLSVNGVKGVSVVENSITFSPEQVAHLKGHLESVQTSATGLSLHYRRKQTPHAQTIARAASPKLPHPPPSPSTK